MKLAVATPNMVTFRGCFWKFRRASASVIYGSPPSGHCTKMQRNSLPTMLAVRVINQDTNWPTILFRPGRGGGGGFWCPRQLWLARNFRQFKIILPYHRTFPQIYLAIWWWGRILIIGPGVAMATAFWRACLAEIWISCIFFYIKLDCDAWDQVFW